MKGKLVLHRERLLREQRRWKRWQKVVSVMAAMVVFCTAYALILPALTMGAKTYCGQEEHHHSEDCFVLLRRGAATPDNGYPILPDEMNNATESNGNPADEELLATPGDATESTPSDAREEEKEKGPSGPDEDYREEDGAEATPSDAWEKNDEAETADSGRSEEIQGVGLASPGNATVKTTSSVKQAKTHSASNANKKKDDWDVDADDEAEDDLEEYDEAFDEDIDLINDLEPEEEEALEADWLPYEPELEYDEELYELICICEMEEHTHSLACYSNPEADVETEEEWLRTIPQLTGVLADDIVLVADSQVEYRESTENYEVEGVDTIKGYTRYGEWYGQPYGDWSGMFASFCINYAGGEDAPMDGDCHQLADKLKATVPGLYKTKDEYDPRPGDLVFLSGNDENGLHVGIIKEVTKNESGRPDRVVAIEGDFNNKVGYQTYGVNSPEIEGYGLMSWYGQNLITVRKETENAVITVVYEESALPEDVRLEIEELKEDDPKTIAMKEKLTQQGNSQGKVLKAMIPFDVTFLDGEGNRVEATGPIEITTEFKTPVQKDGSQDENTEGNPDTEQAQETEEDATSETEEVESGTEEMASESEEAGSETEKLSSEPEEAESEAQEAEHTARNLSVSVKSVTRVGTGTESETEDKAEDQNLELSGSKGAEEPVWELFHMSEDGEPENLSGSDTTKIEVDEEDALHGVTFQSDSSVKVAAVSYERTGENSSIVRTYQDLKNAVGNPIITYIELGEDIAIPDDEIVEKQDGESVRTAVKIAGNERKLILNLARHNLSLGALSNDKSVRLIGVYEGAELTIIDEDEQKQKPAPDKTEERLLGSLHYNDAGEHNEQWAGAWDVGKQAEYKQDESGRYLEYYLTVSAPVDNREQSDGETEETLYKYRINNPGVITNKGSGSTEPAIYVEGSLVMESGAVAGCESVAICSTSDSELKLNGGYVCANSNKDAWDSNIRIEGNATAVMSGDCVISGNYAANFGGAVKVKDNATFHMTGGYITNNHSNSKGGGVYMEENAKAYLSGGYVTNNYASGSGGGIYKTGEGTLVIGKTQEEEDGDWGQESTGTDQKQSGVPIYISRNLVNYNEGGGCTIAEGYARIYEGYLTNNRTNTIQDWGGGGLFISDGAQGYLERVLVTNNIAGGFGGGVTGCPTSRIYMEMYPGMAIFDNAAGKAGTDIIDNGDGDIRHLSGPECAKREDHRHYRNSVFMENGYEDFYCALTCYIDTKMLGGYSANWKGSADGKVVTGASADEEGMLNCFDYMGLKADLNNNDGTAAKSEAKKQAKIFVNGNSSWTHAGGILCNGYMIAGKVEKVTVPDRMKLVARKSVQDKDGKEVTWEDKYSFEFEVYNEKFAKEGTFKNGENWEIDFYNMLGGKTEGDYVYYVKEANTVNSNILMDSTVYKITITLKKETSDRIEISNNHIIEKNLYKIDAVKVEKRYDGQMNVKDGWEKMPVEWDRNDEEQGYDILYLGGRYEPAFVNRIQDSTNLTVRKVWADGIEQNEHEAITVYLTQNGKDYQSSSGGSAILSKENGWTYTWEGLPLTADDGTPYTYSVREVMPDAYKEYIGEITVDQGVRGYWIPAEGPLVATKRYAIVDPSGDMALMFYDPEENDHNVTEYDKKAVTKGEGTITLNGNEYEDWYPGTAFEGESVFTAVHPMDHEGKSGKDFLVLKTSTGKGRSKWLTTEGNSNPYFKFTYEDKWSSDFYLTDGTLKAGRTHWYDSLQNERVVIYDWKDERFCAVGGDSYKGQQAKLYTYVQDTGDLSSEITITNRPSKDILYNIVITKVSGEENDSNARLQGAKFELLNAEGTKLNFLPPQKGTEGEDYRSGYVYYPGEATDGKTTTVLVTDERGELFLSELPAGTYILRETEAPLGFMKIEDMEVKLGHGEGKIKYIEIKEPVYNLPKTGGAGVYWYTLGGMLLMAGSLLCGYGSRRRQERRVTK
ncbi:MAG: Cna B-type domain-containing protein [Lachnospiraceae bacterium]|jgi:LPXTG-motif cell wall-anchored protein|nr:Cna B-type domain-containing protein [Lachnospiraceae bacterium]